MLQTRSSEAHSRAGVPGLGSMSPSQLLANPSQPLGVETYLQLQLLPPWAPSDPREPSWRGCPKEASGMLRRVCHAELSPARPQV